MVIGGRGVAKIKVTMTVDDKVFATFKNVCQENGMKVSSRVELMMKGFVIDVPAPGKNTLLSASASGKKRGGKRA